MQNRLLGGDTIMPSHGIDVPLCATDEELYQHQTNHRQLIEQEEEKNPYQQ
jgi:hypothetical protein